MADTPFISATELRVATTRPGSSALLIDRANFSMVRGDALGIVGESGSGKTLLCRALLGTLPRHGAVITAGSLTIAGQDMTHAKEQVWKAVRGRTLGYVPQASLAGLNPVTSIESQLLEALAVRGVKGSAARAEAKNLLDLVRIPRAERVLKERSHQLSGGMRQRVMIASAIALRPSVLVLDEPTTALDVTVQYEILTLLRSLRAELDMGIVLVTHDLAVVEFLCDRIMTMYAGATVEVGPSASMATRPRHPYTRALLSSRATLGAPGEDLVTILGESPSVGAWPSGCRFSVRCDYAQDRCRVGGMPALREAGTHQTACVRHEEVT